jgi:acetyl esterase
MPLHPQSQAFLKAIEDQNAPGWDELPPAEGRRIFEGFTDLFGDGPELHHIEDIKIEDRLPIRIYRPSSGKKLPVVVYFHGGGWVLGSIATHDNLCRRLADVSGSMIVSVDYRLAPEHPFPAAFDDCLEATQYVSKNANRLGIDPERIAVCGDSAGGNLAAAVALKIRDQAKFQLDSQWLIYPVIEPNFESNTYQMCAEDYGLTRHIMRWFWDQYVPAPVDRQNPYASPSMSESLEGLPYTLVITAEYDVLRSEGEDYAKRLMDACVPTDLIQYDGALHGFMHFSAVFDDGQGAVTDLGLAMKKRLMKG